MNDLSDEAICEYANSKVTYVYDQFQQAYANGVEHGMIEARRRAEAENAKLRKLLEEAMEVIYDEGARTKPLFLNEVREALGK